MSKIAIIGATGRAGSQLLEEALRRGHSVIAIARHASKIGHREHVVTKDVDVHDAQALQEAVAGSDVVLSAAHFSTLPVEAIIEPVKKAGVKRLLFVGGAGSRGFPGRVQARSYSGWAVPGDIAQRTGPGLDLPVAIGRICRRRAHR